MGPGDLVLIPAGVGHKRVRGNDDFQVAGGYPPGQHGNIVRPGELDDDKIAKALSVLDLPDTDPLTGDPGAMLKIWHLIAM